MAKLAEHLNAGCAGSPGAVLEETDQTIHEFKANHS